MQSVSTPEHSAKTILGSFEADIEPIRTTRAYRLAILTVSFVMVLLPLLYVALIIGVGYSVYWHAITNVGMLQHGRGRGKAMVGLIYLAPMVVGTIMTLFMIKPLFARGPARPKKRSLTRDQEPLLFAFVDRVCQAVHAPRPKQIDIDAEINASASFRRGLWSMLLGNDLVLTIGMPLVQGFSLRQFAGVLAHEFGHFSQGAGMRLTYVIRTISMWFTRVVYERDAWDEWLVATARGTDIRIGWVLHLARAFVWLSRRVLWCLMTVGHAVSGYMLRQMEFDADRHETRLAGSEVFATTVQRLVELNVAHARARQDLSQFYREGRLGDDVPRLIQVNAQEFSPDIMAKISESIAQAKTGTFDTHPCDKDRIESAMQENAPGVFRADGPATLLFADVHARSREVTTDLYEELFGAGFDRQSVHSLDELLTRQNREKASAQALERYFHGTSSVVRPLPVPAWPLEQASNDAETLQQLQDHRATMKRLEPAFKKAFESYREADTHLLQVRCALSVTEACERPRADQYSFAVGSTNAIQQAKLAAQDRAHTAEPDLTSFEVAARERLACALRLLFVPAIAERIQNADQQQRECQRLHPVLEKLNSLLPRTAGIRDSSTALEVLFTHVKPENNSESLISQIRREAQTLHCQLTDLKRELKPYEYPFDHAKGPISLDEFVVGAIPLEDQFGSLYETAGEVLSVIPTMCHRLLGRLAEIAELVESAVDERAA